MSPTTERAEKEDRPVLKVRPNTHMEMKVEAAKRRGTLTDLVEEMWARYKHAPVLSVNVKIAGLPEQEEIDASGVDANHLRLIIDFLQREKNPTEERVLKSFIEIITDP